MGVHGLKPNKGLNFAQKPALVQAGRYNSGVKSSYVNVCAKFY